MRIPYFISVALIFLAACNASTSSETKTDSGINNYPVITVQNQDRTSDQTVKDFLCFYSDHYKEFSKIDLVKNSQPSDDTTKYYAVNFPATEKWLTLFNESGFVGIDFQTHWRNYFKDCEDGFQKSHESDGPPSGFDYDFIFNSQEDFPKNVDIQNATSMNFILKDNHTKVVLTIPNYGEITKIVVQDPSGKWLIAE